MKREENVLLSVIIPAYNCEMFIENCIQSIVRQGLNSYEILIVNDGSTDKTPVICDMLAQSLNSIRVFHKKNEGQGIARNFAITYARGEYITFVDADDLITSGTYVSAMDLILQKRYDLGLFELSRMEYSCQGPIFKEYNKKVHGIEIEAKNVIIDISSINTQYKVSSCNKIYKKSIIVENHIEFFSEREVISEDYLFNFDVIPYCKSIIAADIPLYNYRKNPVSYSRKYQENYFNRLENLVKHIDNSRKYTDEIIEITAFIKYSFIKTCIIQEAKFKNIINAAKEINRICNADITRTVIQSLSGKKMGYTNRMLMNLIKHNQVFLLYCLYKFK